MSKKENPKDSTTDFFLKFITRQREQRNSDKEPKKPDSTKKKTENRTYELLLKGVPDIQGLTDLRFSISPEKAFEVIEGANIYDDKFVFLREVIQNALDACKIQMWRDILENRYRSWIKAGYKRHAAI